jgi:lactoylglutathione lyase
MSSTPVVSANVKQAVPFFGVRNMEASLKFYVDGLGFRMTRSWIPDRPEDDADGRVHWCWLELGETALMLQELRNGGRTAALKERLGAGMSIYFQCQDSLALYREFRSRGIPLTKKPFVGNGLWCVNVVDPDGYMLWFTSSTDAMEESELAE